MSDMTEADRALGAAIWNARNGRNYAEMADPVRALVTAELAARAVPDRDEVLEIIGSVVSCKGDENCQCNAIADALLPPIAALQSRAEKAEAERDAMRKALRPFAKLAKPLVDDGATTAIGLTDDDFIAARAALGHNDEK